MSSSLIIPSRWGEQILECNSQLLNGESFLVPAFSRAAVVSLAKWLWDLDLEMTYDEADATTHGAPRETYLLDDLVKVLGGGIYTIAYPTDYGKSTLLDMSVALSLIFWPRDTSNTIVKANEDAAVAAARVVWWKLTRASEYLPYCRPLTGLRQGNPEVKKGFFVEGSELRTFGGRDPSVYPAGIGDSSLPGRRGRAHFDDLETENVVKSEAKMDTLKKQFNSCVRLIQRSERMLFAVMGTPQGANSLMYSVSKDFETLGVRYESITRPEYIQEGGFKGQLRWPAAKLKAEIQRRLMDPAAYRIAYDLKPPGSGWYSGEEACQRIKNPRMPWVKDQEEFRQWMMGSLYEQLQPRVGFDSAFRYQSDLDRFVASQAASTRIYLGWDPASVGTFATHVVALNGTGRYILRSTIDSGTPDEQCLLIRQVRKEFPDLTVILEADATQLAFAHVLMHVDPQCPWAPHMTHGYNKDSKVIGIPSMMREVMEGLWHLPWPNDEFGEEKFGSLLAEMLRWGPVSHPHGIPSLWFAWHFEIAATPSSSSSQDGSSQYGTFGVNIGAPLERSAQLPVAGAASQESSEAWGRRWPSLR